MNEELTGVTAMALRSKFLEKNFLPNPHISLDCIGVTQQRLSFISLCWNETSISCLFSISSRDHAFSMIFVVFMLLATPASNAWLDAQEDWDADDDQIFKSLRETSFSTE